MITQVIKRILLSFNSLVVLILFASILAGYISPENMPYLSIFSLGFPYFIVFNLGFFIFWGFLKHRYALISLSVLLLSIPNLFNTFKFLPAQQKNTPEKSLTVMSYNVRVFDLYNWSQNKKTRDKIFALIRKENPDIACFQEYFNNTKKYFPVYDSLITNQRFNNTHQYFNVKLKNGHNFGIATYSTYPIIKKQEILFNGTHNLAIATDIKVNNDTLRVFNCHLESVRFLAEDYQFIDSLTLLSEDRGRKGFVSLATRLIGASKKRAHQTDILFAEITKSPYPVILCGDFNDPPTSYTYKKINSILNDSFIHIKPFSGGTYKRFFLPLRIDYIMHQSEINCTSFKTIKSSLSDHYPIVGKYQLKH